MSSIKPELDPSLYVLHPDETEFFQQLTGIKDEEELKQHILNVQAKAYAIYGYPCIRCFGFMRMKISRLPGYHKALKLLQERHNPILLDIGCCFGNDSRKAVVDGWPVDKVLASDLRQGFWDYGHELFKSTPATFPAAFIAGDIFEPTMLAPASTWTEIPTSTSVSPDLSSLTSLTPLRNQISAIHASSFFHLFDEERQLELAKRLTSLLVLEKGSVIFGQHGSRPEKGFRKRRGAPEEKGMFCHSPETWKHLWMQEVFGVGQKVQVKVNTELIEWKSRMENGTVWVMNWFVEMSK
ncbi:hypothetical protein CPB84DRAFT_996751 [Gymnopilus junonius]|uniref:Methyltransferase ausD n=1 Tax=Gymnopilus junonius TaxID=109634 RepID=A0A9P5NN99_GYMJU|nr:hypothetical protein CPB84DRAFT_996751 [Gymnopilus junonius]